MRRRKGRVLFRVLDTFTVLMWAWVIFALVWGYSA